VRSQITQFIWLGCFGIEPSVSGRLVDVRMVRKFHLGDILFSVSVLPICSPERPQHIRYHR
jgi:hypothetical protein